MLSQLKPCPFCGGIAFIYEVSKNGYIVRCDESRSAGTTKKTRKFLINLDYEHYDNMLTDEQILKQANNR
jgi:phosphatidate phosphatase PAH1